MPKADCAVLPKALYKLDRAHGFFVTPSPNTVSQSFFIEIGTQPFSAQRSYTFCAFSGLPFSLVSSSSQTKTDVIIPPVLQERESSLYFFLFGAAI